MKKLLERIKNLLRKITRKLGITAEPVTTKGGEDDPPPPPPGEPG